MVSWFSAKIPRHFNGERKSFKEMVLGQLDTDMQINEFRPLHLTLKKERKNLKWTRDLNVRAESCTKCLNRKSL